MSAPTRPPYYFDGLGDGERSLAPQAATAWLIDHFIGQAKAFPDWLAEDKGIAVDLTVLAEDAGRSGVIGFAAAGVEGTIEFSADASGWLLVVGRLGEAEMFRAYLDHPYEEYEFWPENAASRDGDEAPGRISKRELWVSLRAAAWPALLPLANAEGGVNFSIDEARLNERMLAEGLL